MNKQKYERLEPFLHRKGDMTRVALYLIADGYIFDELLAMIVQDLRALELPIEMRVHRDNMLNGHKSGPAFIYPSGNPLRVTDYKRLVQQSTKKVLGHPMSREAFRAFINSSKKRGK